MPRITAPQPLASSAITPPQREGGRHANGGVNENAMNGVYDAETTEELARCGWSYVAIDLCQCEDGRYRYALDMQYSHGGFCGPISAGGESYTSPREAVEAATRELLRRFPKAWASEPQSVHDELRELKAQIEQRFSQPTLF